MTEARGRIEAAMATDLAAAETVMKEDPLQVRMWMALCILL